MILINDNWEVIKGIDDITRIISENISSEFSDDVKYIYCQRGRYFPYKIHIDNCCMLIYKSQDLIDIISEKINYEFAKIVEKECFNFSSENEQKSISKSNHQEPLKSEYKLKEDCVHMSAFDKFKSADKVFWDSSGVEISKKGKNLSFFPKSQFKEEYMKTLKEYYSSYGIDIFDKKNIDNITILNDIGTRFGCTYSKIYNDLKEIQKQSTNYVRDYHSYKSCLKAYYNLHREDTEWLVKIFVERYDLGRFGIGIEDVLDDLHEIMDTVAELPSLKKDSNSTVTSKEDKYKTADAKSSFSSERKNNTYTVPFDLRYSPELVISTKSRWSEKFPKDAGQGVLNLMFPERAFTKVANLAHCAVIVDDCLVQFSENGNMYVLDIVKNTVSTYCITDNDIPVDLAEWIKNTASTAVNMINAIDNNQEAQYFVELYSTILCYHTSNAVSTDKYNTAMQKLRKAFGLQPNSDMMKIVNREWYYGTERKTWGNIALNIFRDYFQSFSTYHR